MKRYLYRQDIAQIVVFQTLDVIDLNESAQFIFEALCKGDPQINVAQDFSQKFEVSKEDAHSFLSEFLEQLESLGINPNPVALESNQFVLHTPIIHIIKHCNSRCIMCDCWKSTPKDFFQFAALKGLFDKTKELGAIGIMISGGEPLLHPEIKEICSYIKKIGMEVYLNTNGFLLHKHLDWINEQKIDEVVISMDSHLRQDYLAIRGVDFFEQIFKNSKNLKSFFPECRLVFRVTLTKYSLASLKELLILFKKTGVDHIGFNPLDISSTCFSRDKINTNQIESLKEELLPTQSELENTLKEFLANDDLKDFIETEFSNGFIAWNFSNFIRCLEYYLQIYNGFQFQFSRSACIFPSHSFVLDYSGDLRSCFYSEAFGSIENFHKTEWEISKRIKAIEAQGICATCRGKIFCDIGVLS